MIDAQLAEESVPPPQDVVFPAIPNTHGPEQGFPPHFVFPTPARFVSYFEYDGDQWRMVVDEDGRVDLRCGRTGWHQNLQPYLVNMSIAKMAFANVAEAGRKALVGTAAVVSLIGSRGGTENILVVFNEAGLPVPVSHAERLWMHASMLAGGLSDRLLSPNQLQKAGKAAAAEIRHKHGESCGPNCSH